MRAYVTGSMIALATDQEMWLVSPQGALVGGARLRDGAHFSAAPNGDLIAYTQGGLWRIDSTGQWSEVMAGLPPGGNGAAAVVAGDGHIYILHGAEIFAYSSDGMVSWQARLPQTLTGRVSVTQIGEILLVLSDHGSILAVNMNGGVCGSTQVYGDTRATVWQDLGDDGILRLLIGDQLLGLDWQRFAGGC